MILIKTDTSAEFEISNNFDLISLQIELFTDLKIYVLRMISQIFWITYSSKFSEWTIIFADPLRKNIGNSNFGQKTATAGDVWIRECMY